MADNHRLVMLAHNFVKTARRVHFYARVWKRYAVLCFSNATASGVDFVTLTLAKLIRIGFFVLFALATFRVGTVVAGYTSEQALLFFAWVAVIDTFVQIFYRGLSYHPMLVDQGGFDKVLVMPIDSLAWTLLRETDFWDIVRLPFELAILWYALSRLPVLPSPETWVAVAGFSVLSFILAIALNIILASAAFWAQDLLELHWVYRDATTLGRFPPNIFPSWVRSILTFVFPVFVVVSFPVQRLLSLHAWWYAAWAGGITLAFVALSVVVWGWGLRAYTSASS